MSIINATSIDSEILTVANVNVNNSVYMTVSGSQITLSVGNIVANSTVLKIDNSLSPIYNTTINTTSISTPAIQINGVQYTEMIPNQDLVDYQVFTSTTASNKWYVPIWAQANDIVTIMAFGGGGGGAAGAVAGYAGGGGGACVIAQKLVSECNAVCNVVVGSGGSVGAAGGSSIFYSNTTASITAYGGGAGSTTFAGGGGGWFSAGETGTLTGGGPVPGSNTTLAADSIFGGAGANNSRTGVSVYGGGGGAVSLVGGRSTYGGGGGSNNAAGGTSVFGGAGGNTSVAAGSPGGGGGAGQSGARGEVRVWTTASNRGYTPTPKYYLFGNTSAFFELQSIRYTLSTQNIANGTTLYYTLNNASQVTSSDFSTAVNGSIVINGNSNTFILTAVDDSDIVNQSITMDIRTGSSTGPIVTSNTGSVVVPITYSLVPNTSLVFEGDSIAYTITTVGVANGITMHYTLNNSSQATSGDFTTAVNGSVIINGGTNTFILTTNNDITRTANESIIMDMRVGNSSNSVVVSNSSAAIIPQLKLVGTATTSNTTTLNLPSGLQQDDIAVVVQTVSDGDIVVPSGWTAIYTSAAGATMDFGAYYKVMGATPDTSVTLSLTTDSAAAAFALRFANTASPIDGVATTTSLAGPSITTTQSNTYIFAVYATEGAVTDIATPTGYTLLAKRISTASQIIVGYLRADPAGSWNPPTVAATGTVTYSGSGTFGIKKKY